ncbi:hypothetical protein NliqN6_2603 [Naganishia liquefaciens]|uniref:2-dehydropantoate 2-reductase n=1 Tax=Naganishia liquefaciens TaxID=104408 RepID=A0A8H3YFY3_9TREE|nr:hypothetical protein NliqN6_2603 [Naganishia liquefaciens]
MRIHVLGVGSIGTLLAFHLRQHLQPAAAHPISLLLRARGIPRTDRESRRRDRAGAGKRGSEAGSSQVVEDAVGGPALSVERAGVVRTVAGFEAEVVGPGIDRAWAAVHRARAFTGPDAQKRANAAAAQLESPFTPATPIDSLIVALKTHQTLPALRQLAPRIRPESCITLLQNGMGIYDELCEDIWPDPAARPQFVLGSTTHGAARIRTPTRLQARTGGKVEFARRVVHTGHGELVFGVVPHPRGQVDYDARLFPDGGGGGGVAMNPLPSLSPAAPTSVSTPLEYTLAALLALHPLNPSLIPMPEMYKRLLLKLSTNCAVNPLTALLGVQNGALIGPHATQSVMRAVLGEASEAITRYLESVRRDGEDDAADDHHDHHQGATPLDAETRAMFTPAALERRALAVLAATARNTSSMASDVAKLARGRGAAGAEGGTEIDYINGFLVRLGERMGVPMPVNRMLADMVAAKEEIARISPGLLLPVRK